MLLLSALSAVFVNVMECVVVVSDILVTDLAVIMTMSC